MTEQIKVAKAWGHRSSPSALLHHAGRKSDNFNVPYLIVSGLSDPEAAALPEIMERERGVCEWQRTRRSISKVEYEEKNRPLNNNCDLWAGYSMPTSSRLKFCPSCGRKVVVK